MSESLKNLAASTGVDAGTIEKVLGGVLSFLKTRVNPETYETIEAKIPEAQRIVSGFTEAEAEGSDGGLLGKVSDLAGKLLGGESGGATDLLGKLIKLGVPIGSITAILPKLFQFLSAHLPADVLKQIAAALPAIPGVDPAALLAAPDDTVDFPAPAVELPNAGD
ncbi:hypothetical protein [Paludisphaera borealis]|uniref:DUF2267 domain-containing protein n=1 Tax=Paludisphaera borealis TaxID=1387353 RepID=A0A1U7CU16_9BACT|nr:hypothetical protein [Paludisphaera borealis]APW62434.1 hypothetical protein BSF38_03979 [Paludisphaera borealis]